MTKKLLLASFIGISASGFAMRAHSAKEIARTAVINKQTLIADTIPSANAMKVVKIAIGAIDNFNIEAVANIYTPNAVVADDEPPYSWNGQTAGVQWIDAVEKACKELHISKFKSKIDHPSIYQQNADNVYMVVPVTFTGNIKGGGGFSNHGAFAFVLRLVNDKLLIKSQVWMSERGME